MSRRAHWGVALLLAAVFASGCMTLDTRTDAGYDGHRVFSGSRQSLSAIGQSLLNLNLGTTFFFLVDLPFSLVADTVLLPVTIGEERGRQKELAAAARLDVDVPGPAQPVANATNKVNAERLFERCVAFFERFDPKVADCYAIGATVHSGERQYTGADYKPVLVEGLRAVQKAGGFMSYTDVRYTDPGNGQVEVAARLAASFAPDRTPASFVLAPGSDGYWRIIESREPPWPN